MLGEKFGRLTVVSDLGVVDRRRVYRCKCKCGNYIDVKEVYLKRKEVQSCGCLKKDLEEKHFRNDYDAKRVDGVAVHLFDDKPRKDSSTGYRGVSRYKTRVSKEIRYRAWITVNGKQYYKSGFKTAADAYYNGRLKLEEEHLPCGAVKKENRKNDIIGQRFGKLTVIGESHRDKGGRLYYLCKCDCGNETSNTKDNLTKGRIQSCGCARTGFSANTVDITGKKFGKLTVVKRSGRTNKYHATWLCKCECGNETIVMGASLRSGNTRSCGCIRKIAHTKQNEKLKK